MIVERQERKAFLAIIALVRRKPEESRSQVLLGTVG